MNGFPLAIMGIPFIFFLTVVIYDQHIKLLPSS